MLLMHYYYYYYFFLIFFKKHFVGTQFNCLNLLRQFNEYRQHGLFEEVDKSIWAVI